MYLKYWIAKALQNSFHMKKWKGWKTESQSFYKIISLVPLNIFAPRHRVELYPSLIGGQYPILKVDFNDLVN